MRLFSTLPLALLSFFPTYVFADCTYDLVMGAIQSRYSEKQFQVDYANKSEGPLKVKNNFNDKSVPQGFHNPCDCDRRISVQREVLSTEFSDTSSWERANPKKGIGVYYCFYSSKDCSKVTCLDKPNIFKPHDRPIHLNPDPGAVPDSGTGVRENAE